jgi:L-ascorbate metabolism protein UlaG (beta-lactamase superfamily)
VVEVNYVGHATVLIDMGRVRVLTDPILRDRVFFLQRHGPNPALDLLAQRAPDVVLLSHLHYDHADLPSLRRLAPKTPVIAPQGSARYLGRWAGVEVQEVVEGDQVQIEDVEIYVLPAEHSWGVSIPRPMTACVSYVIRNQCSVYFAGDTDLFDEMYIIGDDFGLDLALLPVWGFSHRVGTGHLTPLSAAQALTRLRPRVAVPTHWGSFRFVGPNSVWETVDYLNDPPAAFAEHAARLAPQTEVRILQPGQWTSLS